jgi:hypothetical protein
MEYSVRPGEEEDSFLTIYREEGCIITLDEIRIIAKVLQSQNMFPDDVKWPESFIANFEDSVTSYFAAPSEVDLIEQYCCEHWQIFVRFNDNVPNSLQLIASFSPKDSRKKILPSVFRPEGNTKPKFG